MNRHKLFLLFSFVTVLSACLWLTSCSDSSSENNPDFDRTAMLQNMADNLIIPAYSDLLKSLEKLQTATSNYTENPTQETLSLAQTAWENAYRDYQYANAYNFGPAGSEGLRKTYVEEVGVFPVAVSKIEESIASGEYSLTGSDRDARGFLTVEYLLFDLNDDNNSIISNFKSSANRKKFLNDLVSNIYNQTEAILTKWNETYASEFVDNNGTNVGSSTSELYNEFLKSFEALKNYKIGLPLGKVSGQVQVEPTKVEAYYSGKSVEMFKTHMQALENIWYGRSKDGVDGIGFEEYLENVTGGADLVGSTKAQLENIDAVMSVILESKRLSVLIEESPSPLEELHTELQKNTRYFKSDMSSLLGIAITFSDADGD